jgi:hypothetical protein
MKLIALIAALALTMSIGAATASAATQYEGKVVGKSAAKKTFRLKDAERGTIRIKVTRNTTFEDLAGFRSLHRGMRGIEATVKRSNERWVAIHVEKSGGGGNHGGDNRDDD